MNQSQRYPFVSKVILAVCLFVIWLSHILPLRAQATSWPTDWSFETLESSSSEWWNSLRIGTVPGVLYHLQESEFLAADSWTTVESTYGTGAEWICPLFQDTPPSTEPIANSPIIPATPTDSSHLVSIIIEKTSEGEALISWRSLDDGRPKRIVLLGVTLNPVWDELDSFYLQSHGSFLFTLSPRLGTPLVFSEPIPVLGLLDTAMVADFTAALPEITTNISNGTTAASAQFERPPDAGAGTRKFFRVAADWSLDSDGDGRYDWQEIVFDGNNPYASDSDGNGIPDVAQDNSGPAPTLDEATVPAAFSNATLSLPTDSPPHAIIERNFISAYRNAVYRPNWPGWQPVITVTAGGPSPYPTESLRDLATYAEFSEGVANLPLKENGCNPWYDPYYSDYFKSDPLQGESDPRRNG